MVGTLIGPFSLSFDKKVAFYKHWKYLFPAMLIVAISYLIWDEFFTQWGVWGFNPIYLQGIYLGNLPLEEICFFFFVPYACIFVYACLVAYFPDVRFQKGSQIFAYIMLVLGTFLGVYFWDNLYTASASIVAVLLTIWFYFIRRVEWYDRFILTFLVVQIPFFVVNGALTGMFTPEPIVWYNENEMMGPRWVSIPMEDTLYNYGFLLLIFSFYFLFQKRGKAA